MAQYFQIEFQNISTSESELLIAELNEIGFDGFEEGENALKAYVQVNNFDETILKKVVNQLNVHYSRSMIKETNWNQLWESNFQPVIINDLIHKSPWVTIRAAFHKPIKEIKHEIVITPKMSFGTGHHATTGMMIQQMSEIDFHGKTVLDFGTGTGVLSILAEKLGAKKIIAIDNDDWSIENAKENFQQNHCKKIELIKANDAKARNKFDIILANINKNVILENFLELTLQIIHSGILIVSGILEEDEQEILNRAKDLTLIKYKTISANNWICIRFCH